MKIKEYLHQAYRLDKRIQSNIEEMEGLREMATSVSSPSWDERVQTSRCEEAKFVRCVERIMDLERRINAEVDNLIALKEQIRCVINEVSNTDERMVLRYRYVHNFTWEQIGDALDADRTTVYRWHNAALKHAVLPDVPIKI